MNYISKKKKKEKRKKTAGSILTAHAMRWIWVIYKEDHHGTEISHSHCYVLGDGFPWQFWDITCQFPQTFFLMILKTSSEWSEVFHLSTTDARSQFGSVIYIKQHSRYRHSTYTTAVVPELQQHLVTKPPVLPKWSTVTSNRRPTLLLYALIWTFS